MDAKDLTRFPGSEDKEEGKMDTKALSRREFLRGVAVTGAGLAAAACAPTATPPAAPTAAPTEAPAAAATAAPTEAPAVIPSKEKIVIGAARPISGPLSVFEEASFGPIYKMWVEEVNAKGGIYVEEYGKQLPVEMLVYDDKSDMGTMTRLLEKLIVEDQVDFVFPPASTAFLFAAGAIANKYGYIMMGAEGGATTIEQTLPGMPYFFGVLNYSNRNQIPVLADLLAEWGAKSAAIIYIADLHGIEYSGVAGIEFDRVGIETRMLKSSPPYTTELELLLKEARDSEADVLCAFTYPPTTWEVVMQSIGIGYSPAALVLGPGGYSMPLRDMAGLALSGVIGEGAWSPKQSPAAQEFYDNFVARMGEENIDMWGHLFYWGGIHFFEQAIEKAGTLDQEVIREVMATSTFETALGPTWFDQFGDGGCLLAVESMPGQIGQWQWDEAAGKCVWEVIGPKEKATAEPIHPKPPWPTG
jgi:branched-chain amino acid transport system substrate-binding protein